jgi:hypothetical protein
LENGFYQKKGKNRKAEREDTPPHYLLSKNQTGSHLSVSEHPVAFNSEPEMTKIEPWMLDMEGFAEPISEVEKWMLDVESFVKPYKSSTSHHGILNNGSITTSAKRQW